MLYPSRTARLALRAWREEDRPAFAAMNADERVMEYFPATLTAEESADLLDRIRDEFSTEGFGPYASNVFRTESCWDSPDCTA